jgi:hypothetical protein
MTIRYGDEVTRQTPGEIPYLKLGASVWRLHAALVAWDDPAWLSFEETDFAWSVDSSVKLAAMVAGERVYDHELSP